MSSRFLGGLKDTEIHCQNRNRRLVKIKWNKLNFKGLKSSRVVTVKKKKW